MLEIPAELQLFVEQEMKTGLYSSEQDLVNKALKMLQRKRLEALEGIRAGFDDLAHGREQPLDAAFADLRKESPCASRRFANRP